MDIIQTIKGIQTAAEGLGGIGALVFILLQTRSAFVLRSQAWRRIFGKDEVTNLAAAQFVANQTSLAAFAHHAGLKMQTIEQMECCIEWLDRNDIGPRQLRAIRSFFDLTTMKFRENLPGTKGTLLWFLPLLLLYALSLLGPSILWSADRAYYEFNQDGYAFSATTDDVRTVNSFWRPLAAHHSLVKADCVPNATAPSDGFTVAHRIELCGFLRDPKLPGRVAATIVEQRNSAIAGIVASMLGVFVLTLRLRRIEMAHALRRKVEDADRQLSFDFCEHS